MNSEKLVSYKVIVAAKVGDSDAMRQILQHYEPYIIRCSQRTFYDEYGNRYQVVDEEIKNRIQAKLMYQLIYDFDPCKLPSGEREKNAPQIEARFSVAIRHRLIARWVCAGW